VVIKNKTAAIILAAGESKRFGKPKQLLNWFGKSFINQIIENAKNAGLDPIIVVLGSSFDQIKENIINSDDIIIVKNTSWSDGQSTSLIAGLNHLCDENDSFVFLLSDQPQIPELLITNIVSEYRNHKNDIVITEVNEQKLPPILFDRCCSEDILKLKGDQGGKSLLKSHPFTVINWEDERLLIDVDTDSDYKKLLHKYE
jgi:molybdenum cofactor cytidylyltransferase